MWYQRDRFGVILIFLYLSCFYLVYPLTGTTSLIPSYQDETQWFLYSVFIRRTLSHGFFPLWTPDLNCGMPLLAWSHAAALDPLSLIFALGDYARAVWLNQWLRLQIYCLGLFCLCRRLGASLFSTLLTILILGALNVFEALGNFLPALRTGSFAPWHLLCALGLVRERRLLYLLWFIGVNVLMYLGGHIELIGLGYELLAVSLLGWGLANRGAGRRVLAGYLVFTIAFLLGYLASQAQTLPTLELTRLSIRGVGLSYSYFKSGSSTGSEGMVWIRYLLPALVPVAFAAALAGARRSGILALTLLGLAFCAALIHNCFEILWVIYHLPVLRGLLGHARIALYAEVLLAVLIALGTDHLLRSPRRSAWLFALGLVSLALAVAWLASRGHPFERLLAAAEPTFRPTLRRFASALDLGMALQASVGILLLASPWLPPRHGWIQKGLLWVSAAGVYALPVGYSLPRHPADVFAFPPEYPRFFQARPGLERVQTIYPFDRWDQVRIPLQSGVLYGTRSADGFVTVSLDRYTRFLNAIIPGAFREEGGRIADLEQLKVFKEGAFVSDRNLPWLNFLGLRYLVTERRNLKFPDHFYLAYPDSPFLVAAAGVAVERRSWSGEAEDALRFTGRASAAVHLQAGDRLEFALESESPGRFWLVRTLAGKEGSVRLEFARGFPPGRSDAWQLDLGRRGGGLGRLEFLALDLAGRPASGVVLNPAIVNPAKYFRQLPWPAPFRVFENPGALPPAFLVSRVWTAKKPEALARLLEPGFNPAREAVVEEPRLAGLPAVPLQAGEGVELVHYSPERVELRAAAAVARMLVLTDAYFPGWRAWVDGKEERIWPVNYAFRGVVLDAGRRRISLRYQPVSFRLGLWITLASLLCLGAAAGASVVLARSQLRDQPPLCPGQ